MKTFTALLLALFAATWLPAETSPAANPLAWLRFTDAPETYAGDPYLYLANQPLQLSFEVAPRPGLRLEILWGAKGDERTATLVINGREMSLAHGGYDGFRWLVVRLPAGLTGDRYDVGLRPAPTGKSAFVAEVRLVSAEPPSGPPVNLTAPAYRVTRQIAAPPEAFPAMRPLWDRERPAAASDAPAEALFRQAERNGRLAAEAFYRCRRFVDGWLAHADPASGLIPRGLNPKQLWMGVPTTDLWNGRDAAADNYPFMVLTCALTDRPLFTGRMRDILRTETRLTKRVDRLGDNYRFSTRAFLKPEPVLDEIVFDNAEYVKDGLIPLTEWLGPSPWSERMVGLVEDLWQHAPIETPFGRLPTLEFEVNGDLLQACARIYWFTGQRKFLDWAIRLGDFYLLGTNHPTRDLKQLRLVDHGCEVVNGLSELYFAVSRAAPEKQRAYAAPLHAIYDSILAQARNEHGMLYEWYVPQTGGHAQAICDTWGYVYDGFYTMYLVDGTTAYRDAVRHALAGLKPHYTGYRWQGGSADGYADSLEGAINLINREPDASAAAWIDAEMRVMWSKQKADGVIEGWHGDGNFARTSIMFALWKTQGVHVEPWRADVRVGAVRDGDKQLISLAADQPWTGRLLFDAPRHQTNLRLPVDYPRINQFAEWFTATATQRYAVRNLATGRQDKLTGKQLIGGLKLKLAAGQEVRLEVSPP